MRLVHDGTVYVLVRYLGRLLCLATRSTTNYVCSNNQRRRAPRADRTRTQYPSAGSAAFVSGFPATTRKFVHWHWGPRLGRRDGQKPEQEGTRNEDRKELPRRSRSSVDTSLLHSIEHICTLLQTKITVKRTRSYIYNVL